MGVYIKVLLAVGVLFLALYVRAGIPRCRVDPEAVDLIDTDRSVRASFFSDALSTAASSLNATGGYVWGRTTAPRFSFDLHPLHPVQRYTELKEFVWMSVTSGPWLVGFAVLQLQFADNLVMQVYRRDGDAGVTSLKARVSIPLLSPVLGWGTQLIPNASGAVGPAAPGHRVRYRSPPFHPNAHADINFTEADIRFDVQATLTGAFDGTPGTTAAVRVVGTARYPAQSMALCFPLGRHRPSLVLKMAAVPLVPSSTVLTIDVKGAKATEEEEEEGRRQPVVVALSEGLLAMDYTRGLLRRHTKWYWASFSDPRSQLGVHLSSGAYDADGVSTEASLFDNAQGTATFLDEAVVFHRLGDAAPEGPHGQWTIASPSVSLVFSPHDGYGGKVDLKLICVNLDHRWGTFSGTVKRKDGSVATIDAVLGVFEEHDALW